MNERYERVSVCVFPVDGRKENVMFDKITSRISKLCYGLNQDFVDPVSHRERESEKERESMNHWMLRACHSEIFGDLTHTQ